jgi:hypothetical protein
MTVDMMTFPVTGGIQGMNTLAVFLNALHLSGEWHFGRGTRFDDTDVTIDFDDPADRASAWQSYRDTRTA